MNTKGKHIVITGATSGVGRELVEQLAPLNRVTAIGRNPALLEMLQEAHPSVRTIICDLSNLVEVERVCGDLAGSGDGIDVLICNAAVQNEPAFADPAFDPALIAAEVTTNFTSIALMVGRLLPVLARTDGRSAVTLVNSALALAPKANAAVYCATKAALRSLGRSLAHQLATRGIDVVTAYLPLVDTAMTRGRGSGKIGATAAATGIIEGIRRRKTEHFIGKARVIGWLYRLSPGLTARLMLRF